MQNMLLIYKMPICGCKRAIVQFITRVCYTCITTFLANVNSRSRSLYAIVRPSVVCLSVCRLSVTFVHPTQAVEIFGTISAALGTLAIH